MEFTRTGLDGPIIFTPKLHFDDRGYFFESFRSSDFADIGPLEWVQDNESFSEPAGTVRGIHYQLEPHAQAKLVRVVSGAIFDVAIDLRKNSATYGQHVTVELSAEDHKQFFVPIGFGHAFMTLTPQTRVQYKVAGSTYSKEHERSILWSDPALGIEWPDIGDIAVSDKDAVAPLLADIDKVF